ncbi:MAG: HAD-IB family phosphatase [Lachnospiraceae bacterium]|nr:HAD-IB family phosphatase [Lachnospiraceae bacterium]
MNIYDFDKTIYRGDSSIDFFLYCLKRRPRIIKYLPKQVLYTFLYALKKVSIEEYKSTFFSFLNALDNTDKYVDAFWQKNREKIKPWYLSQKLSSDLIISASPYFLLEPICRQLNVDTVIATDMNKHNAEINGKNCKGKEKVNRLFANYPNAEIESFYSDSTSDAPLAKLAKHAFIVQNNEIIPWVFSN